jgi:hypothetical protein
MQTAAGMCDDPDPNHPQIAGLDFVSPPGHCLQDGNSIAGPDG